MLERLEKIVGRNNKVHCLKLFRLIKDHPFLFCGFAILATAILYFGIILYMHKPFSTGEFIGLMVFFSLTLMILVPIFVFLLACCEIIAEYLACLLFPRSRP